MFNKIFAQKEKPKPKAQPTSLRQSRARQTFTNQDAINFMRRYSTAEQDPASLKELTDEDRRCCFTSNYLVFNLGEKMPQLTQTFLEQEDSVLDYCKTVNFNRKGPQQTLLDEIAEEPMEIDGDNLKAVVSEPRGRDLDVKAPAAQDDINESMYCIDVHEDTEM